MLKNNEPLDLRKKPKPVIIERIVLIKRLWYMEILRIVLIVIIVLGVVWGISKADDSISPSVPAADSSALFNTSNVIGIFGVVTAINGTTISIDDSQGSDYQNQPLYFADVSNVQTIETANYAPLTLSDIEVGDTITAHGILTGTTIAADQIISFSVTVPGTFSTDLPFAPAGDVTNSRVLAAPTATTTDLSATSTPDTSTTTPDSIATSTDTTGQTDTGTTTDGTTTTTDTGTTTATTTDDTTGTSTTIDTDTTSTSTSDITETTTPSMPILPDGSTASTT